MIVYRDIISEDEVLSDAFKLSPVLDKEGVVVSAELSHQRPHLTDRFHAKSGQIRDMTCRHVLHKRSAQISSMLTCIDRPTNDRLRVL